jgi:hypothetical protein
MYIEVLTYNTEYMEKLSTTYRLFTGTFTVYNSSYALYQSTTQEIANSNTIIGLTAISISNKDQINFFQ